MVKGRAKLSIADGLAVWLLEAPDGFGDPGHHAHHAIQLAVALGGTITIEAPSSTLSGPALAVAADMRHRMTGSGLIAIVFVDPDGAAGRALAAALLRGESVVSIDGRGLHDALCRLTSPFELLTAEDLDKAGRTAIERLVRTGALPPVDPRIGKILAYLRAHPDASLAAAAEAQRVFLSPERLRHLFVEQTGLPHKSYVLWLRMTNALRVYSQGATLTEAAHAAGFADSAHLSRVFRRTFGLPATTLTRV